MKSEKAKNVGIFIGILTLILGINLGVLNFGFTLVSFAQETDETREIRETVETEAAQETPFIKEAVEEALDKEETAAVEGTEEELDLSLIAEYITYEKIEGEDLIIAKDGVELKYQDIEVKADYLKINLTTNLFFASGEVFFLQDETETHCEELTYNWKTKKTILLQLKAELTGEGIKGKVYYQGEKMENFPETVEITEGSFTTCELEEPHYRIVAKEMIIYPKDKIVARNISWYEGKKKIITLPYFLIFLDRKTQQPILPKIGQNSTDGWFIKTNVNYYINNQSYGTLYFDWMQKRGLGIGVEQTWEIGEEGNNPGEASLYLYQSKKRASGEYKLTGEFNYSQEFGDSINTYLILKYNGDKTIGSNNPLDHDLKSKFKFSKEGEKYDLDLTGTYTFTGSGLDIDTLGINGNITVNYDYYFSDSLTSYLDLVYTDKKTASQEVANQEFNPKWTLKMNGDGYTLTLLTQKRFDLEGDRYEGDESLGFIDRLPEFTFDKSSDVIGNTKITYDIEGSIGRFYEGSTGEENTRGEYIINVKRPFDLDEHLTLTASGIFQQDVYLTGEARYLAGGKLDLKAVYNPYISSNFSYNYYKSEGPTPFNFDYISPLVNTITGKFTITPTEKIKMNLSTNYNFVTENFGNLTAKLEYNPKEDWEMDFNTTYNLNDMEWNKRLGSKLDLQLTENWRVRYSGILDLENYKLSNSILGITRDLHCREFTINYKQATKSIWVEFLIKAFPTEKITIGGS